MARSHRSLVASGSGSVALAALLLQVLGAGCASAPDVRERNYEAGGQTRTTANVRVELTRAVYRPRALMLAVVVTNLGSAVLRLPKEGILLEDRGVELPIEARPEMQVADITEVPAGDKVTLELPFATQPEEGATLRFRGLERAGVVDVVDLPIPGPPPPQDA